MKMETKADLNRLVGVWESVSLRPTVMITHNYDGTYHLIVVHINEHTRQASPAVYGIMQDDEGYWFASSSTKRQNITYDNRLDTLCLSKDGEYNRS